MEEIIKEYPLDKRYKVSNMGYIVGVRGNKMKPFVDSKKRDVIKIKGVNRYVHQIIAETFLNHTPCGHKIVVDHIDNNPQNNNINNLQLISHRENLLKDKANKTSKYRGVYKKADSNKYRSQVMLDGKMYYLGIYNTEDEAYIAYIDTLYEYNEYINE